MKCNICGNKSIYVFTELLLNKYNVKYYLCKECGYIHTEYPFWIEESYSDAITDVDTGIMKRNEYLSMITSCIISEFFDTEAQFCDYGGGYGILTRMLRDIGFDYYWCDKYATNILAKGFEYNTQKIELLTAFELFEHLNNPLEDIKKMFDIANNILFCTDTYSNEIPEKDKWWYYSFETGQHISFYSIKTLEYIADKFKVNYYTNGFDIHLFTKKKLEIGKFKDSIYNYENKFKEIKQKMISRTFSDMNITKLKKGNLKQIKNLEYGYYNFIDMAKNRGIVIFGTGSLGKRINKALKHSNVEVEYFSDNNIDIWGKEIDGIKVIEPKRLKHLKNHLIVIGSSYYIDIYKQLELMNIEKNNIFHIIGI